MNSLILCAGEVTKNPYYFSITDTKVYSIEELCYYLFNNIYVISPELIDDNLVQWIDKEIKMPQLAEKIKLLIIKGKNLKDMVTTIMCSSDYYNEQEIRNLIDTIDRIEGMPEIRRRKIKADNLLKYNNYSMAGREYESILASKEAKELEDEYYGNILHNLGIVKIHTSSFMTAAACFKEAYKKNN
ncbi:MAG: hypothetical protein K6G26_14180, partial [Lachnospiraceae bacterium]|nr:hypothetical protein [Lachnospiraceae bacterium]